MRISKTGWIVFAAIQLGFADCDMTITKLQDQWVPDQISIRNPQDPYYTIFKDAINSLKSFPLFPHVVLKALPDYGLLFPDVNANTPPLTSADIDQATGAVVGQADYYLSTERSLRLDEFQKSAADPFALIRVVSYDISLGSHRLIRFQEQHLQLTQRWC